MKSFDNPAAMMLAAMLVMLIISGCTQVREPWTSGDQYKQERMRSPETTKELDHRLRHTQTDR